MLTLEVKKENAQRAYDAADESTRALLVNLFGKDAFTPQDIRERVKTFEDACEVVGITGIMEKVNILPYRHPENTEEQALNAVKKLWIIAQALNESWTPNWNDTDEKKWYPWFKWEESGFGFSVSGYGYWYANTFVGSRLSYRTRELAEYAATQFKDLYNLTFIF